MFSRSSGCRRALCPPSFYLTARPKIPRGKVPSPHQEENILVPEAGVPTWKCVWTDGPGTTTQLPWLPPPPPAAAPELAAQPEPLVPSPPGRSVPRAGWHMPSGTYKPNRIYVFLQVSVFLSEDSRVHTDTKRICVLSCGRTVCVSFNSESSHEATEDGSKAFFSRLTRWDPLAAVGWSPSGPPGKCHLHEQS